MKKNKSSRNKSVVFYLLLMLVFAFSANIIAEFGEGLQDPAMLSATENVPKSFEESFNSFKNSVENHIESSFGLLLLQIIIILLTCKIFGWVFNKLAQPTVIGEVTAGIFLGPSVLGLFFPDFFNWLFRPESLININLLSQFGLILFMFTIGMELDLKEVKKRFNDTVLISHSATVIPFFCGMIMAYYVYESYAFPTTPFLPFALFLGISMSVTAFPILARIIQERGLTKSNLGTVTLASAANGDITAWCLLAVIVAVAQAGTMLSALFNIFFSILYIAFMFLVVRPFLRSIGGVYHNKELVNKSFIGALFLFLIVSAYFTELLGLHALFGAFMAGVVMPDNAKFRNLMTEKTEDISLALFLPLFFVSTGLRTEIGLLNTPDLWILCVWFIVIAVLSKVVGAYLPAKIIGENNKNSLLIGAFMNTRGLTELIILAIGYEMKILPPEIFVILVLMTLITTLLTSPILSLIEWVYKAKEKLEDKIEKAHPDGVFNVLLSFGRPKSGELMLDVAQQMFAANDEQLNITALHLTVGNYVNPMHIKDFEKESFTPILTRAQKLNIPVKTRYEVSSDASIDICNIANDGGFDFLLVGAGISMSDLPSDVAVNRYSKSLSTNILMKPFKNAGRWFYPGDLLKDKTKYFIENAQCPVGVFVNRNFEKATNILVYLHSEEDRYLLPYAQILAKTSMGTVSTITEELLTEQNLEKYDFMIVAYNSWNIISESHREELQSMPSTLIVSQ